MPEALVQQVTEDWERLVALLPRIGIALVLLVVAYFVVGRSLAWGLDGVLRRGRLAESHRQFFRQLTIALCVVVALAIGLDMVGLGGVAAGLLAGGGMTAVVLAFAFRGIGENLLAGLFLAFSRPFEVGHLVRSGEHEGTVRSIAMRSTHIRTADGRDIYVPNAQIFNEPLVNFTRDGLLRSSYTFGIDWADDAATARDMLLDAVRSVEGVLADPAPAVHVTALSTNTVDFTIFFWLDVLEPRTPPLAIRSTVLDLCRRVLLEGGFTVSSNVASNVALAVPQGLDVRTR